MSAIEEFYRPAHNDLLHDLEAHGFVRVKDALWAGNISTPNQTSSIHIDLSPPYPAYPPRVRLVEERPLTWHQNVDGSMCLYSQSNPGAFPWFSYGGLLAKISEWLGNAEADWVDETPDLDLERYWEPSARYSLLVYDELPNRGITWARFDRSGPGILSQTGFARPPKRRPGSHTHLYGLVADVGELSVPTSSWTQLAGLLDDAVQIEDALRQRRADVLLIRYRRHGHEGVLGLAPVEGKQSLDLQLKSFNCASRSPSTLSLRAGFQSTELRAKSVTVVGVGAVGSFVAEGLFRSGVKNLLLVDSDRLRPGNLIRHAALADYIGQSKADAMARSLGPSVVAFPTRVDSLVGALRLVDTSDLVIDATANEVVAQLLAEAGRLSNQPILSVYLANQGRSKVVEMLPSPDGERLVPAEMTSAADDGVESGCGDPVSPTPPFAAIEVAGMACRIAAAILIGDHQAAKSELREEQ